MNNTNCVDCDSSEKKIAKTSKNYNFLAQLLQKWCPYEPRLEQETILSSEITTPDHKLSKTLILSQYHIFRLSFKCFSILCDAFLLKSVISSHSSCE